MAEKRVDQDLVKPVHRDLHCFLKGYMLLKIIIHHLIYLHTASKAKKKKKKKNK